MKRWESLKSLWHRIFPSVSSKTTWERHHIRVLEKYIQAISWKWPARPRRSMTPGFSSFRVQIFNPFFFVKVKVDNFVSFFTFKYKRRDTPALYLSKLNFAQTSQNNRWGLWNLKVRVISHEQGVPLWWTHVNGASVSLGAGIIARMRTAVYFSTKERFKVKLELT